MNTFARIVGSTARRGFTLVEVLIVVVILGILAAIIIPQCSSRKSDGVAKIWDRKASITKEIRVGDILRVSVDTPTLTTDMYYEVTKIVENKDPADGAIGGDKVTLKDKDGKTVSYREDLLLHMSSSKWDMEILLPTASGYDEIKAAIPADSVD